MRTATCSLHVASCGIGGCEESCQGEKPRGGHSGVHGVGELSPMLVWHCVTL